jgi:hypothetical protein
MRIVTFTNDAVRPHVGGSCVDHSGSGSGLTNLVAITL